VIGTRVRVAVFDYPAVIADVVDRRVRRSSVRIVCAPTPDAPRVYIALAMRSESSLVVRSSSLCDGAGVAVCATFSHWCVGGTVLLLTGMHSCDVAVDADSATSVRCVVSCRAVSL